MDASVFNGALYLDEQEHDFTLTLPSNITSADFTLQFRYYQSYTAAPQADSYIKMGDFTVFQFNGAQFLDGSGTALANTPIGSWNEIALIRDSGTLYYYLNGVCIGINYYRTRYNLWSGAGIATCLWCSTTNIDTLKTTYTSCERGSNERQNRILRRYFPKGQSMAKVTQKDCDRAADAINSMPRKIFDYKSSADLFAVELEKLQSALS